MWLEAILSRPDLEQVFKDLTPTTIALSDEGSLQLDAPSSVTLAPAAGIRIVCRARLQWVVLGVHLPVTIESATVILEPVIRHEGAALRGPGKGDVLAFLVRVEALDVAHVPSILESRVVERLNAELASRHAELVWDFKETLSQRFNLPALLSPARSLDVHIAWGELRITEDALVFVVSVHVASLATVAPDVVEEAPPVVAFVETPAKRARQKPRLAPKSLAVRGGLGALAVSLAGFAIGVAIARNRRPAYFLPLWTGF